MKKLAVAVFLCASLLVAQVQIGKNVQIGSAAGGGGAGNPAAPFSSCQFNNSGVFGGGPGCLLDSVGNMKTLSYDGTKNAFLNQTTPTSNDGIRNALQTPNTLVVAGNDYPCVEGSFNSAAPNYRLGIGVPAPFANGTTLLDDRSLCGGRGLYAYNPNMGATGNILRYDRIVSNQLPTSGAQTAFYFQTDTEFSGSGINSGFTSGGPDSFGRTFDSLELMTRGIQSVNNIEEQAYSQGDNHLLQFQITNNRGSTDINGEGFNTTRAEINQNLTPLMLIANSTLAAGATLIQGTLNGNVPFPGDGTYLIDSTRGGAVVQIINDTEPGAGGTIAGQWQVNTTLTPDNVGSVAAGLTTIPIQRYGATTNATVTITGLTSALSTSSTACVADHIFQESVRVVNAGSFSGGTATGVVLALRYPHQPSMYVSQGSHACNVMEIKANGEVGSPPSRQLFRIIGAIDSTHYLYSRTTFGGWDRGLSGYANTYDVANAGVTLTRNGSGVVTVPVSDGGLFLSLADVTVASCADSSFNGIFRLTSDTGTAVTWANAGAAGTTTCTKDIEVLSKLNNVYGIRDAQEFPACEIVNTVDPVTFANNFNLSCEPNTNLHVIAGDQLENHPYADVIMGFDRNIMAFQSQTTPSAAQLMHADQVSGATPEGTSWYRISFTDNPQGYQGLGGSKPIGANLINMSDTTTPFGSLFLNMPVPTGTIFSFNGCVYGCADGRSKTTFFSFAMNGGSYFQTINQADHSVVTMNQNTSTGEVFNKNETDQGLAYFTKNGLSGTSEQENFFEWIPGFTEISTSSNSGSIKNILTMTPTGTTFSQPITVPSCTGCGSGGSISLTTTGTSGAATLTGSVLNIPVYTAGAAPAFSAITGGTNTTATMVVGTGASLAVSGSGTIAATAAPLSGITGLGTGVGTFLATPSSANLAAAITNETGTGLLVFATAPTITLPNATGLPLATGVTGLLPHANIASTAVTPGSYTSANITVAADGSITAAANGSGGSLADCTDTSTVSFICTVPISAPSFSTTGTTPGAASLAAGTGSIPTLPANSAGLAAPVTGGTSYLLKLPATITAGILHAAAPGTVDGVNESAVTSSAVSLTTDVTGVLPAANIAAALSSTTSVNGTTIPASATLTQTIASGTAALGTAAIASGACATVVTATATGTATTDVVSWGFNGDITAVTGYAPVTTGGLALYAYPTANTFNVKSCNPTNASITPGAVTLNWRVAR